MILDIIIFKVKIKWKMCVSLTIRMEIMKMISISNSGFNWNSNMLLKFSSRFLIEKTIIIKNLDSVLIVS